MRRFVSHNLQYFSLNFCFSSFPVGLRGTLSKIMWPGHLYLGSFWSQNRIISSTVNSRSGMISIIAAAVSPSLSSGIPITATSRTHGCFCITSSISTGNMFSPPRIIRSFFLSTRYINPSSSFLPRSPVYNQPSLIEFFPRIRIRSS